MGGDRMMGFFEWLKSFFGGSRASANQLLDVVRELKQQNAGWEKIWERINPKGEHQIHELLVKLRGPHMFAPHVGLNVLEAGCERAIKQNSGAGAVEALREALAHADRIVR